MNTMLLLSIAVATALLLGFAIWAAREVSTLLRWLSQPFSEPSAAQRERDLKRAHEELLSR